MRCWYLYGMQKTIDIDRLEFPKDIADTVGLQKEQINFLKRKGCPFFGRKTTIRWVRSFIAKEAGAIGGARRGHHKTIQNNPPPKSRRK